MNREIRTQIPQQTQNTIPRVSGILQRKCACGTHTVVGGECTECQKAQLQRRAATQVEPAEVPAIVHEVLHFPGQPLDPETRAFMEPRFEHDFSQVRVHTVPPPVAQTSLTIGPAADRYEQEADRMAEVVTRTPDDSILSGSRSGTRYDFAPVRVHTDAKAAESAQAVNALVYTVGQDMVFGAGQYSPETREGRKLIAHELTHTIQQKGAGTGRSLTIMRQPSKGSIPQAGTLGLFPQMPAGPRANCSAVSGDPFERQPTELQAVLHKSFGDAEAWFRGLGNKRLILTSVYNRLCQFALWNYVDTIKNVEASAKPFLGILEVPGAAGSIGFTTEKPSTLKSDLLNTFRFCADSPLGGSQHREQASFREVSTSDSLHVAIGPSTNFDAHIDRYSPAIGGGGSVCVYDPVRAAAHIGREVVPPKVRSYLGIPGVQVFPELLPTFGPPEREVPPPSLIGLEGRFPGL